MLHLEQILREVEHQHFGNLGFHDSTE